MSPTPIIYKSDFPSLDLECTKQSVWAMLMSDKDDLDKPALVQANTGTEISYSRLYKIALSAAHTLRHTVGLKRGDVLAILCPNTIGFVTLALAAQAAGITVTPINCAYSAREVCNQLKDSSAAALFAGPTLVSTALQAAKAADLDAGRVYVLDAEPDAPKFVGEVAQFYHLLSEDELQPEFFSVEEAEEASAFMCYSSGTTGKAKGVQTTHTNANTNAHQISGTGEGFLSSDKVLAFLPIFHLFALTANVLQALLLGCTIVLIPRFEPEAFLDTIETHKITVSYIAPPVALFLAKDPRVLKKDLSSLRWLLSGAAPLGGDVARAVQERINVQTFQGYGLTETSPAVFMCGPSNARDDTVGKLLPNQEVQLVKADGTPADPLQGGELWIRGPNVMKGYLNRPEDNAISIDADGFFHTGDVAVRDSDGYFRIVDRLKDLLKYNGYQVCPSELEAVLTTHADVQDAAVVGLRQPDGNDLPAAFIALKPQGAEQGDEKKVEISSWFSEQVAGFKRLRGGIFLIDKIPRSAAGKILRKELVVPTLVV